MEANGCVQQLDLAEISIMSMLKLKNDVKIAKPDLPVYPGLVYLFTQAWSTRLHRPRPPVHPGLVYLITQAWSTCLPRPGQKGCATSETIIFKMLARGPTSMWAPGPAF